MALANTTGRFNDAVKPSDEHKYNEILDSGSASKQWKTYCHLRVEALCLNKVLDAEITIKYLQALLKRQSLPS